MEDIVSCPICFEHYNDPRSLSCAHQFCVQCLEKIKVTKNYKGETEVTCPTCRFVTLIEEGASLRDLPRPVLMNEVQKMVEKQPQTRVEVATGSGAPKRGNFLVLDHVRTIKASDVAKKVTCIDSALIYPQNGHLLLKGSDLSDGQIWVKEEGGDMKYLVYDDPYARSRLSEQNVIGGTGSIGLDFIRDRKLIASTTAMLSLSGDNFRSIVANDVIDVTDADLHGVTYILQEDLYAVSDVTNHQIILLDPKSRSIVRRFGSRGSSQCQFLGPFYICTYTDHGKSVIVVSDKHNHRIQLFDVLGKHIRTYGEYGMGEGQLFEPQGVTVDPLGRILVSDCNNSRVVMFWEDLGAERWTSLLSEAELGGHPYFLAMEPRNRKLLVGVDGNVKIYSFAISDSAKTPSQPGGSSPIRKELLNLCTIISFKWAWMY